MKLNRKFIACALATTMAVAPMSAFAADEDTSEIKDAKISKSTDMHCLWCFLFEQELLKCKKWCG